MSNRFEELLPWYVNGTISAADRQWMEHYLRDHPDAMQSMRYHQRLAAQLKREHDAVSDDIGLDRVMARIAKTTPAVPGKPNAPVKKAELNKRSWLADLFDGAWLKPAFAMCLVVVAVQGVMLFKPSTNQEQPLYRGEAAVTNEGYLQVNFDPTISEAELRILLISAQARFVSGPDVNGAYYLAIPNDQLPTALKLLKEQSKVINVAPAQAPVK